MEKENLAGDENKQEAPHGSMEPTSREKQEGSTALRDNGANDNIIPKKKMTLKRILKMTVLFIIFLMAWFAIVQYMAADKYEAVVKVMEEGGKIGVNPMTERLDYGDLPKGNASTRFITIENRGGMDIYVAVVKYGGIAELIKVSRNNFVLDPGEKEKLELLLEMPISADKEEYKGKVLIFKLPKVF